MNNLTSHQRKMVYLVGMGLLFIPVITLGFPAAHSKGQSGGALAQMRQAQDLGESTLGDVDPGEQLSLDATEQVTLAIAQRVGEARAAGVRLER